MIRPAHPESAILLRSPLAIVAGTARVARTIAWIALGFGLQGCMGLAKAPGASEVQALSENSNASASSDQASAAFIASCPANRTFNSAAQAVLRNRCLTCHVTGPGATDFALSATGDAAIDYLAARAHFNANAESAEPENHPILQAPLGGLGHVQVMNAATTDFVSLQSWVRTELSRPCGSEGTDSSGATDGTANGSSGDGSSGPEIVE